MGILSVRELVAAIRRATGETQEALARRMDVSFATVNSWERGRSEPRRARFEQLKVLADEAGVDTELSVLALDDDPISCAVIEGFVTAADVFASVVTTTDATTGLMLCGALKPDLFLIDVMMPGIDGFEVAAQMEGIEGFSAIRVVFITSASNVGFAERARAMGHRLVQKPLTQSVVNELLREVLSGDGLPAMPSPNTVLDADSRG